MALVKTPFACLTAISLVALLGFVETGRADIFQTDNFSGTITFNSSALTPSPAGASSIFSLNYVGTTKFDETKVAKLSPALQVYKSFISDGGSLSLTLLTPFGNYSFTDKSLASGSSVPTMVVQNNKAVAFDFNLSSGGFIPLDLNVQAPIPNPVKPGSGTLSYTGVQDNITLTFDIPFFGDEVISAKTVPKFTVIPEPSTMLLIGLGTAIFGMLPRRQRGRA